MNPRRRLFVSALRFAIHGSASGIVMGLVGAGVYWLAAQLWPTSVAVVLSMLATTLVTVNFKEHPGTGLSDGLYEGDEKIGAPYWVFVLLIKYNALMALSAASLPFPLPAYLALGLIMVAAHAASRALMVSIMATNTSISLRATGSDLSVALILGLAPAALLGVPGLIGLAAAIAMRLGLSSYVLPRLTSGLPARLGVTQQLTEISFYLGALATWKYV